MTSGLRKAHKYIWLLLIIIVPVLLFFSTKDLDIFSSEHHLDYKLEASKLNIVKSGENKFLKASLIKNDSSYKLEVILKSPLKNPSTVIYNIKPKGKFDVIGQIESVGIYHFDVPEPVECISIFDKLKDQHLNALILK